MACPGATEEGNCDLATRRLEVFIWVGMVDVKRKQPGLRKEEAHHRSWKIYRKPKDLAGAADYDDDGGDDGGRDGGDDGDDDLNDDEVVDVDDGICDDEHHDDDDVAAAAAAAADE